MICTNLYDLRGDLHRVQLSSIEAKLMPDYHDEGPADLYSITLASLLAAAVQSRTAKWEDEIH